MHHLRNRIVIHDGMCIRYILIYSTCLALIICICFPYSTKAQHPIDNKFLKKDSALLHEFKVYTDTLFKQADIVDIVDKLFNKHIKYVPDSIKIRPGKLLITPLPGLGYTVFSGITAVVSVNISFYSGKHATTNLSTITFNPEYSFSKHQVTLPVVINMWSKNNAYNWVGDIRYLNYPSYTYGLGSLTTLADADLINYSFIRLSQEVLKKIAPDVYVGFGYHIDYHWNITQSPTPGSTHDFTNYNANTLRTTSTGPVFDFLIDQRRNINSPEQGYYVNVAYGANLHALGSSQTWQSLLIDLRKYIRFPIQSHNILAFWSFNWLTLSGNPPYLDLPSTNWDTYSNTGRGFIKGRFTGKDMLYFECEYRFAITHSGFISGVVFANAETFTGYPVNSFQRVLPAAGPGLRFKVNKYAKINFVADYGFAADGSHGLIFNLGKIF